MFKSLYISAAFIGALLYYCMAASIATAAPRRAPKVYNALITTDDNLLSSRAYPIIQPIIHRTGLTYPSFGLSNNRHSFTYSSTQPCDEQLTTGCSKQLPYPLTTELFPPQYMEQSIPQDAATRAEANVAEPGTTLDSTAPTVPPPTAPAGELPAIRSPVLPTGPAASHVAKVPISLKHFGLPPALIPLLNPPGDKFSRKNSGTEDAFHLLPYEYNPSAVLHNPINENRSPYLSPYDYYSGPTYPIISGSGLSPTLSSTETIPPSTQPELFNATDAEMDLKQQTFTGNTQHTTSTSPYPPAITSEQKFDSTILADFEVIRNGSKSTDNDVADVPPPPIPSGAKSNK